ncbi:cytochrome P450 71D445-like [Mercurialis annua]|uniref:cytochrome P450 71D445-like n=1 Tax=Mercurialis annua TaxID=3986 RepID=UPI00215DDD1B|nr:cytochrome P450 71D445-like [Mercurialis annua]
MAFLMILITILFIFFLWKIAKTRRNPTASRVNLPPGPFQLPFIGNIHHLLGYVPHLRMADLADKHGPIMHLQLGELTAIVLSSAETTKELFKTHDLNVSQRPRMIGTDLISYNNKDLGFSPEGPYWRQLRKLFMVHVLSVKRVQSFRTIREEEVSRIISAISSKVGSIISLNNFLYALTFRVVSRSAIGEIWRKENEYVSSMEQLLIELAKGPSLADVFPSIRVFKVISRVMMKFNLEMHFKQVDKILQNIVDEHRARTDTKSGGEGEDFVDILLDLQNKEKLEFPLMDENIKAIILDMFIGGASTTFEVIEWTMTELNPRVMEKAQAEVRQIFGANGNVDEAGINQLSYLKLVINESLRLHPPAPLLPPRETKEKCTINGYDIPAKSYVMLNLWAIGRDPKCWNEADKFYPERFVEDDSIDNKKSSFEYLPFGAGRRICPGNLFAMAMIELPVAQMLYHFDWMLPAGITPENIDMSENNSLAGKRKSRLCLIPNPYVPLNTAD